MAACILHNLCIIEKDNIDFFLRQAINVRPLVYLKQFIFKLNTCISK